MKSHLRALLARAIEKAAKGGELELTDLPPLLLETPKQKEFGDLSTNIALLWAKQLRRPPRQIAEAILERFEDPRGIVARAEIAGPGFLNFTFSPRFLHQRLLEVAEGRKAEPPRAAGKAQVEFASVNPTGPLHVGHGRVAVIGDVLARLLAAVGYRVEREYYVNDAGRQIALLGESIYARYRELLGAPAEFPEEGYRGEYLRDIALRARERWGRALLEREAGEAIGLLSRFGCETLLDNIRATLARFGIAFDSFVSERALRDEGRVAATIDALRDRKLLYRQDGAEWFRATAYGDDKDRTVVKSDGELTYFAADMAYHRYKYERGYDRLVNVWGADHHGYVSRLKAAIQALGYDPGRLEVVLVQMVHLTRRGEPVRMGKRLGEFVTLDEVLDEVGSDAARFFFLMRKADSHLDFDLELAKEQSAENPVFYVQYAHARVASIFEQARQRGIEPAPQPREVEVSRLELPEELELIKLTAQFEEIVEESARELEPHRLVFYLLELAGEFHRYYNRHRVLSDDLALTRARLLLAKSVQSVIAGGLELLGVAAPFKMAQRASDSE